MSRLFRCCGLLLVLGVAACDRNSPTGPTVEIAAPSGLSPTLSSIQTEIFNPSCFECHGDQAAQAGLDLTEGESFSNLVNVQSVQVTLDLVEPNDAENSYLIHKLEGRPSIVGDLMPAGAPALTTAHIDVIKQWINSGAQNN